MKVKTIILSKLPSKVKQNNMTLIVLGLLIEAVVNTVLPFMFGVYFALTKSAIFFGIFIFMLLFNVKIDTDRGKFEIKILRGF